jgi:hypothetical protein
MKILVAGWDREDVRAAQSDAEQPDFEEFAEPHWTGNRRMRSVLAIFGQDEWYGAEIADTGTFRETNRETRPSRENKRGEQWPT